MSLPGFNSREVKMDAVTIDQMDIKVHERYALDQEKLDTSFIKDSALISHYSEVMGITSIYSSKWEELFEIHVGNLPWAAFSPPPKFHIQKNRFFSHRIIPSMDWADENEDEEKEEQQKEGAEVPKLNEIKRALIARKLGAEPLSLFEKDKTALINLLDSIKFLNCLLREINAKKLQYQKG